MNRKQLNIRIDLDIYKALQRTASLHNTSMTRLIENALTMELGPTIRRVMRQRLDLMKVDEKNEQDYR